MAITQKIKNQVNSAKDSMMNAIASSAQLSSEQLQEKEKKREEYLSAKEQGKKADDDYIIRNLSAIGVEVFQDYLPKLHDIYEPYVDSSSWKTERAKKRIRYFDITKWVTDKEEKSIDKLTNVYQVLSRENCNIALIYSRDTKSCTVTLAIVNNDADDDPSIANDMGKKLRYAIDGNFSGTELGQTETGVPPALNEIDGFSVAVVSNLATEKSENFISQSMEKLLDGIVPQKNDEKYSIILLAQPIISIQEKQEKLYEQYSAMSPFANWQASSSISEATGETAFASAALSYNRGTNSGVSIKGIRAGKSVNLGVNYTRSSSQDWHTTISDGETRTFTNYAVKHTLSLIEDQVKRLEQCSALGMWDFAAYIISKDGNTASTVANTYLSLTQGNQSYMTCAAINVWRNGLSNNEQGNLEAETILAELQRLQHPHFCRRNDLDDPWMIYPSVVSASVPLSGTELAHALNFPRKSVSGLPVFECVPFGREVIYYDSLPNSEYIKLGVISHMRKTETGVPVFFDRKALSAHTFVTGSTGSGKSNTVYTMLNALCPKKAANTTNAQTHFLVIEPAKGEYKDVFGGRSDVAVYGTNFKKAPMLHLNPFAFPDDTHVLEHIDRLVEVFNACWPMYAAMPAVLKAAIETAYINCGWNLQRSTNLGIFPTFHDVMKALPAVVDSKGFSNDTQGDYKGALLARLESLTNGIYGQVLCAPEEIPAEDLFDKNVIIDLSRVGSSETKALLMGILVLKLQEHRMAQRADSGASDNNNDLRHITVLEEAHTLLRRTSMEQSQESSNLQGKSVEMLTNAIAEMRTYGEGFIIADQAPGLLDLAVIRNTNTKIILRLPDESDRKLVGKAAGLNDDQIVELSRLDTGVAAVYQNHWLEPVLCKVTEFTEKAPMKNDPQKEFDVPTDAFFNWLLTDEALMPLDEMQTMRIRSWLLQLDTGASAKRILLKALSSKQRPEKKDLQYALYAVVKGKRLIENSKNQVESDAYIIRQIQLMLQIQEEQARLIHEQIAYFSHISDDSVPEQNDIELGKALM